MSTAITENELVGKNKQTYKGRGLYPTSKSMKSMHKDQSSIVVTRAQEMKGFKKENRDYGKNQQD